MSLVYDGTLGKVKRALWKKKKVENSSDSSLDSGHGEGEIPLREEPVKASDFGTVDQLRQKFEGLPTEENSAPQKDYSRFLGLSKRTVGPGLYQRKPAFRSRTQTCDSRMEEKASSRHSLAYVPSHDEVGEDEKPRYQDLANQSPMKLWRSVSTRHLATDSPDNNIQRAIDSVQRLSDMRIRLQKSRENLSTAKEEDSVSELQIDPSVILRPKTFINRSIPAADFQIRRRSYVAPKSAVSYQSLSPSTHGQDRPDLFSSSLSMNANVDLSDPDTIPSTPVGTRNFYPEEPKPPVPPRRNRPISMAAIDAFPGNGPAYVAMKKLSMASAQEQNRELEREWTIIGRKNHTESKSDAFKRISQSCLSALSEFRVALDDLTPGVPEVLEEDFEDLLRSLANTMEENSNKLHQILNRKQPTEVSFLSTTLRQK